MKKIMFNDDFLLTEAVLDGTKPMTRRIIPEKTLEKCDNIENTLEYAPYKVGEIVAIAQEYFQIYEERLFNHNGSIVEWAKANNLDYREEIEKMEVLKQTAGYSNKMFVKAEFMLHHIKFTGLRAERLQGISEEDCLKEGIIDSHVGYNRFGFPDKKANHFWYYPTAREAFAALIDKVGKRGTWDSNPWVYAYTFEVVD